MHNLGEKYNIGPADGWKSFYGIKKIIRTRKLQARSFGYLH